MRKMWGSTIYYHSEARNAIARGVNAVAELVQATMGPMGKNIIIERAMRYPFVTKDGVTVANHIKPKEPREAIGADLCRNAAQKTDEVAGDGTTTAIVLTQELIEQGIRLIEAGFNPVKLKQGMDLALQTACQSLEALSIPADSYEKIFYAAAISAKEQEIGQLIADAMEQVGKDGIIMIREGLEQKTSVEVNLGLELEKGYLTPNFITKGERLQLEMDHVAIYMTDAILKDAAEAEKLLRWCKDEKTNLLVIAKDVVKDALGVLVETNRVGKVAVAAVEAPGYAESRVLWLDDIAAACGGTPVSSIVGTNLANAKKSVLGHADHVKVTRTRTMISGGDGDKTAVEARVRQLKAMLAQETEEEEQKKLEQRIARLTGGVATIRVGGATKVAMQERKYRIEDAVHAAQAAAKYGILDVYKRQILRYPMVGRLLVGIKKDMVWKT